MDGASDNTKHRNEMAADGGACIISLDTRPPPIQSGCACRGDSGLAHIACLVQAAASQQAQRGSDAWQHCQTCKQYYTGAMQTGLAEAWRSWVAGQAAESTTWLVAESNLGWRLVHQGKAVEVEPMFRSPHEVLMRVHGAEHPNTLTAAGNLAMSSQSKASTPMLSGSSARCLKLARGHYPRTPPGRGPQKKTRSNGRQLADSDGNCYTRRKQTVGSAAGAPSKN